MQEIKMDISGQEQPKSQIHHGIVNRTGCTCYIASVINLLFHCFHKFRCSVIGLLKLLDEEECSCWRGQETRDLEFLRQLSILFVSLSKKTSESRGVDATEFYETLRGWDDLPLNLCEQGDAASMLSLILSRISNIIQLAILNANNDDIHILTDVKESLQNLEGSTLQTIIGTLVHEQETSTSQRKRVQTPRIFRGPFPVTGSGHNSLLNALTASTIQPQKVERYKWTEKEDEQDSDGLWITHRSIQFQDIPKHFIVQLKRFRYDAAFQSTQVIVTKYVKEVGVPIHLDLSPFIVNNCEETQQQPQHMYLLQGAIAHAGRNANDGHYLTLIDESTAMNGAYDKTHEAKHWIVFDDDRISKINVSDLSSFTNGGDSSRLYDDDEEMPLCAMLLLYSRVACDNDEGGSIVSSASADAKNEINISTAKDSSLQEKILDFLRNYSNDGNVDTANGLKDHDRFFLMAYFKELDQVIIEHLGYILFRILIPNHEWSLVVECCRLLLPFRHSASTNTALVYVMSLVALRPAWELFTDLATDTAAQRCIERCFASCLQFESEDSNSSSNAMIEASWDLLAFFVTGVFDLLEMQPSYSAYNISKKSSTVIQLGCRIVANGMSDVVASLPSVFQGPIVRKTVTRIFHLFLSPSMDVYLTSETMSSVVLKLALNAFVFETRCFPSLISVCGAVLPTPSSNHEHLSLAGVAERFVLLLSNSSTKYVTMQTASMMEQMAAGSEQSLWVTKAILNVLPSTEDSFLLDRRGIMTSAQKKKNTLPIVYRALLALTDVHDSHRWERISAISSSFYRKDNNFSEVTDTLLIFIWRLTKRCYRLGLSSAHFNLLQKTVENVLVRVKSQETLESNADVFFPLDHLVRWPHACPAPIVPQMILQKLEGYLLLCSTRITISNSGVERIVTSTINGGQAYLDYDSDDDPNDIVDLRIAIKWANGFFYSGKITSYNEESNKHHVQYDDGDDRAYHLLKKTWTLQE